MNLPRQVPSESKFARAMEVARLAKGRGTWYTREWWRRNTLRLVAVDVDVDVEVAEDDVGGGGAAAAMRWVRERPV